MTRDQNSFDRERILSLVISTFSQTIKQSCDWSFYLPDFATGAGFSESADFTSEDEDLEPDPVLFTPMHVTLSVDSTAKAATLTKLAKVNAAATIAKRFELFFILDSPLSCLASSQVCYTE